ncbi:MAG: DUF58 domain-containing protein [Chloroflexi bacterium OHK40]
MMRHALHAAPGRFRAWLTLDGRLTLAQPLPLVFGAGTLAVAVVFPARWLLFIAYAYLLAVVVAYGWLRLLGPRLTLSRHLRVSWAQVGDELEEIWELRNGAPLPLLWLELDDASTLPGYNARRVVDAAGNDVRRWRTIARCERRGVYRLGPVRARCGDPLGIFAFEWGERAEQRITVYPPIVRLPPLARPSGQRGGLARADLLQVNVTPNVAGVRAYAPGDPPGRLHWPFVARHGSLFVKEFDQERAGALWIVLDLAAGAYPAVAAAAPAFQPAYGHGLRVESAESRPATPVDLAVTLAASLAAQALAEGRAVGLLCDDGRRRLVPPGSGARQLWRILAELVDGEPTGTRPLGELLRYGGGRELDSGGLAVITGALDAAWLPALAERLRGRASGALVLLVAPTLAEAAPCEALLASHGLPTSSFAMGTALPLLNPPRQRGRLRVSPLGRVVREGERR